MNTFSVALALTLFASIVIMSGIGIYEFGLVKGVGFGFVAGGFAWTTAVVMLGNYQTW